MPSDVQGRRRRPDAGGGQALGGREGVVGVQLGVGPVYDPRRRAVRPDAGGIVVGGVQVELLRRVAGTARKRVGVQLDVGVVCHPHGRAVRPDAGRIVVGGVQVELLRRVAGTTRKRVGVQFGVGDVRHPHGRAVRPDAVGIVVGGVQVELLGRVAGAARKRVGVQLGIGVVCHPHGRAVRPDAVGIVVGGVQVELLGRVAGAARKRVGVQLVDGPVDHPHGRAVRPDAVGSAVGGVQVELPGRVAVAVGSRRERRRPSQQFGIRATAVAVSRVRVRRSRRETGQVLAGSVRGNRTLTGAVRPARRLVVPRIRVVGDGQCGGSCRDVGRGERDVGSDDGRKPAAAARGVGAADADVVLLGIVDGVVRAVRRPGRDGDAVLVVGVVLVGQRGAARVGRDVRGLRGVVRVAVDLVARRPVVGRPAHGDLPGAAGGGEVPEVGEYGMNDDGIRPRAGVAGVGVHRADGHSVCPLIRHLVLACGMGALPLLALVVRGRHRPGLGAWDGRVRHRAGVVPAAGVPGPAAPPRRADDVVPGRPRYV